MCSGGSATSGVPPPSTRASTSCLRTRPPRPVPCTAERSIPCSAAIRCTTGEYRREWPLEPAAALGGAGSDTASGAAAGSAGAGAPPLPEGAGSEAPSLGAIRASTDPTVTVDSTGTRISVTTPVTGAGTSVSILSVEMSQIADSASIVSPTPTRQPMTVPSATDTPIWGIVTSTVPVSVGEELTASLPHALDVWQYRLLERWRERNRHIRRGDAHDRTVQILEALLGDHGGHLSAGRAHPVGLVEDHHLRAARDGVEDRLLVHRHQRAQVEHLDRGAVDVLGGLERDVHHRPVGDDHEVGPGPRDTGRERRLVHALWHLALDPPVEVLVLHVADRIRIPDGRMQQPLGVLGGRGRDDLDPGRVHEPRLRVLGVIRASGEPAATWKPHRDRHGQALAVVHLPGDIDQLVEAAGDEVGELHLADRAHADDGCSDRGADDPRLGQRGVHHPVGAELLDEAVSDLERAAEHADVLAHHHHALIGTELVAQGARDGLKVGERGHSDPPLRKPLHGACPSPSTSASPSQNTPIVAVSGSGIGALSASFAAASISAATSALSASMSTPTSASRADWRSIGSRFRHSSTCSLGTYFMSSWAACPCMRMVTASISVGPSPDSARSRAARVASNIASASFPSTVTPTKP